MHTHCLDAIFYEEINRLNVTLCGSQGTARASPRDRRLRAPRGAAKTGGQPEPAGPVVQGTLEVLLLSRKPILPRKEVIQPHVPVRLPCYDFTPLTLHTFDASAPKRVRPAASGADDSGGVTGGVYKTRERIHRGMLIRDY